MHVKYEVAIFGVPKGRIWAIFYDLTTILISLYLLEVNLKSGSEPALWDSNLITVMIRTEVQIFLIFRSKRKFT